MNEAGFKFLSDLIATPSVSGFEQAAAKVVKNYLAGHVDDVRTDVHGNTIFSVNTKSNAPRVMLAGHIDQIGFLVRHITDDGYLYLSPVGGIDTAVVPGSRLQIHSTTGKGSFLGVIGRKAIHMMKTEERDSNKKTDISDFHVDIGVKNRAEALEFCQIGDPVTFELGLKPLGKDFVTAHALDDRVGVWVMAEAMKILAEKRKAGAKLHVAVYAVATVQEEIGLRGAQTAAYGIDPVAGIAIDVGHATDTPGVDEKSFGKITMGAGPEIYIGANINPRLNAIMENAAKKLDIPMQRNAAPRATGTDANTIQISRSGVATAIIGLPCRYMHTQVEVVSKNDLYNAAKILAETLLSLTPDTNYIPGE